MSIIPIVLHKIIKSKAEFDSFEDVDLSTLRKIFINIGKSTVTTDNLHLLDKSTLEKYYIITFDDGNLSDYSVVFPLLKEYNIKAIFFINPVNIGNSGFIDWSMVKEMSNAGMVIGSHGYNHLNMTKLKYVAAKKELVKSKKMIEDNIGKPVNIFSFPFGSYNKKMIDLALKSGYRYCFTSDHGVIQFPQDTIPRNSINRSMNQNSIEKLLHASFFTRLKWILEDLTKKGVKKVFGGRYYKLLRDIFLKR